MTGVPFLDVRQEGFVLRCLRVTKRTVVHLEAIRPERDLGRLFGLILLTTSLSWPGNNATGATRATQREVVAGPWPLHKLCKRTAGRLQKSCPAALRLRVSSLHRRSRHYNSDVNTGARKRATQTMGVRAIWVTKSEEHAMPRCTWGCLCTYLPPFAPAPPA